LCPCALKSSFSYTTDGGAIGNLEKGSIPKDNVFAGKICQLILCHDVARFLLLVRNLTYNVSLKATFVQGLGWTMIKKLNQHKNKKV
jgi:hypothetical protein